MAENGNGNGRLSHALIPIWRGGTMLLLGFLTWQASRALEKLENFERFAIKADIRLEQHDKTLDNHAAELRRLGFSGPRSLVGPQP